MSSLNNFFGAGSNQLARRLDQLCSTLEGISARLRSTIATVIGESIGGIVRDVAWHVLSGLTQGLSDERYARLPPPRRGPLDPNDYSREEWDYWDDELDPDEPEMGQAKAATPEPARLRTALSTGLQAASWWLRRYSRTPKAWATLAVGFLATGVAFYLGPVAVAMLNLAGSASQFCVISGAVNAGASRFGP